VVNAQAILTWVMSANTAHNDNHTTVADVYWRGKASHFFHGELVWLKNTVLAIY
jgi:hypothetical protein